jgi:hypothetical protein
MSQRKTYPPIQLEDIPNIGPAIAADLRQLGIARPEQLAHRDPIQLYHDLEVITGERHDPCILYTLMAAVQFLETGRSVPWWKFTTAGKALLKSTFRH